MNFDESGGARCPEGAGSFVTETRRYAGTEHDLRAPSRLRAFAVKALGLLTRRGASGIAGALALAVFFAATLPRLGSFPKMGQDEPWIAAPAAKLAAQGVYGDDLFAGYFGMERRTYNFPPLFPLAEALAFRLLGVGAWQARLVAVLFGAATVALTYAFGRRLYGGAVGALAAWLLVGLRLTVEPAASGVPLLDLARIARYDIAVPPLVLATLLCFVWAETTRQRWRYLLTGILAGLALLAHLYGGFVLAVIGALLLWRDGPRLFRRPAPYLLAAGLGLALLPWALYIAADRSIYYGQMLPERGRFDLLDPAFYLDSLLHEPARYRRFFFDDARPVLWPRLGIWLALAGLPAAAVSLLRRTVWVTTEGQGLTATVPGTSFLAPASATNALPDRLALLALPILALLLGLLVNLKFYNYAVLLLPFVALNLAWLFVVAWRAAGQARRRAVARLALGALLCLTLAEGAAGIANGLRAASGVSDYQAYTARVAQVIPPGARVLALHQFWFGLYPRRYVYRSLVLPTYLASPRFYPNEPLTMEQALERLAPEYILVDGYVAPDLRLDRPAESLREEIWRSFRRYLDRHGARPVARIDDRDYGVLIILRLKDTTHALGVFDPNPCPLPCQGSG